MPELHVSVLGAPGDRPPAVFVHGVLSWGTDELYGFGGQRPLAGHRRLLLVDRRGHGASPDVEHGEYLSDYEADAADLERILGTGAHLVGHSYGAVAAMLAAARRPHLVHSLCLIQPGSLRPAEEHPVVAEVLARNRAATATVPPDLTPEEYLVLATQAVGMPAPEPTPQRLRAARAALRERPCWDADVPLAPLRDAGFPALVVRGDWTGAPAEYRRLAGEPLMVAAEFVAERMGAELLTVPGYYPQVQQPEAVNAALAALWERADVAAA